MNIEISAFTADNNCLTPLIELGRTYYPAGHHVLTEDFLKWFYLDNPAGPATLIVAHEGDLWIGLIALIPVMLESSGRLYKACYAVNVLTHPEYRGKNLFIKLISHARELLSREGVWLLGHPNTNAIPGWKRQKMEFRDPFRLFLAKFRLPFSSIRETHVTCLAQLHTLPSSFWNELADRPDVRTQYTPEYIEWRFLNAPHRKYVISAVEKDGNFLGLRIARRFKGPIDLMIDFVAPFKTLDILVSSVRRPTLVMHPGFGCSESKVKNACWLLPVKRQFPFFVTTWGLGHSFDMSGITLSASDF